MDPQAQLAEAFAVLDALDRSALTEGTLADYVHRLELARRITALAKQAESALELAVAEAMPAKIIDVDHLRVERKVSRQTGWKPGGSEQMRDDVAREVAAKQASNPGTGEIDVELRGHLTEAITEAFRVVRAPSGLMVGPAKRYGLELDNYREATGERMTIHLQEVVTA